MEEIYKYLYGKTDDSASISMNVETGEKTLGATFESIINPVAIVVEIKEGNDVQMMASFDGGIFHPIGIARKGINTLALDINPETGAFPRCREINISYKEFSQSACILGRLAVLYYDTDEVDSVSDEDFNNPTEREYN
ncbi:hypothetical protein M0R04_06060 [Candidatus Dojkabacteria bacterium]|jgi:hypothetical protein|nr:hypothetical protein [Candidatus Dojkabacteria bacterium]